MEISAQMTAKAIGLDELPSGKVEKNAQNWTLGPCSIQTATRSRKQQRSLRRSSYCKLQRPQIKGFH
jgi:hypothetical protein